MRGDAALIEALERAHIHPLWDRYKRITPVAPRPKDPPMHDAAAVPVGTGTFGSRSIAVGGSALHKAAEKVPEKGRHIAAHLLEAAAGGIKFEAGRFKVAGTDRAVSFDEVARAANVAHRLPLETLEPGLDESAFYDPPNFAFSNGAHICELEVDPETGAVELVSYHAVDDIGTVINPLIVEGRLHGGLTQGIGQALHERRGPAPVRLVHGLRRAARGRAAELRLRDGREPALHPQPARRQGLRRVRRHRRAGRGGERAARCAGAAWRGRHRDAGYAIPSVARHNGQMMRSR